MNLTKSRTAKFVAGLAGFAIALSFVVTPVTTSAATIAELQAMIASLSAQLAALSGTTPATTVGAYTFNTNLTVGSKGADVMALQKLLNASADTKVASTGAGSPGMETSTFGPATKAAVMKFQTKYGISPVAGYVGAITRAKLNTMGGTVVTPGTPVTPGLPTGGSMTIAAGSQPANSLAPQSAARIPFTTFSIAAGTSDVTVNSVTVERAGLSHDAVFSGVVLLRADGTQIGIAKTLNSIHQASVGEPFVVKAGTTETFTVAGNMAASLASYAGEVAALNVVAVNTSATVTGSLPITGAQHTTNATLSLGSVTMMTSSYDPNTAQTKEIGTTGYKFAGVRVTAGSAEDVRLFSVRFNQSGSASSNDLSNVKVYVDGTAYDTTVSVDGKYYSANFGAGLTIAKGLAKDIYIQGDIVGSGSAGRTIKFDIYKTTDLYLKGETYGYGITPPVTGGAPSGTPNAQSEFTNSTPWFDGSMVTVSGGSATSIGKATSIAAANIAVNVPNQVLGGFTTDIKGEPISVQTLKFTIATSGSTGPITNITIVDSNGAVIAGPVDEASTCTTGCLISFNDTITFPIGIKTYTIKGKIPTGATGTIVVSANPSTWESITGQTTGNAISFASMGSFAMNTMTVKQAALTISVSSSPASQSIVTGGQVTFGNYQLDASQSGEDIRLSTLKLAYDRGDNALAESPTKLTSCQLFDGSTALNTGSNVVNPIATTTTAAPALTQAFTFDSQYTVPKGTVKTLTLKCNVSTSANNAGVFQWGLTNGDDITVTGITSGANVLENIVTAAGPIMTVATGSFTAGVDYSTPNYATVSAGSTGVNMGVVKFHATNEDVNLQKIGLVLTSGTPSDVGTVYLYQGSTLIGTAIFTGVNTSATSTLNSPLLLAKDADVLITIKTDLGAIGTGQTGTEGQLIKIDALNAEGSGVSSGNTLGIGPITAGVNGVRMFKSFPVVAQDTLSSSGLADGRLMRFKITADSRGPVGLYNLNFTVATSGANGYNTMTTGVNLNVYSDSSYSSAVGGAFGASTGQFGATTATITSGTAFDITASVNPLQIPAGQTYYFELKASVAGVTTGSSVTTTLNGDAAYLAGTGPYQVASTSGAMLDTNNDFIWSGNATSTAVFNANDWANGYGILGLPAGGFSQTRSN